MRKIKLGEVLQIERGCSLSGSFFSESGKYVRLTLGNFKYPECGFKVNEKKDDLYYVGPVREEFILKKGDIITPLTEQVIGLLGNTATIPESDKYIQSGDIGLVIPKDGLNARFAYYLLSSPMVKKQLAARSQQTKIRHTSPAAIHDCTAYMPEYNQQKLIARLLDSINKQIKINESINDNLMFNRMNTCHRRWLSGNEKCDSEVNTIEFARMPLFLANRCLCMTSLQKIQEISKIIV